MSLFMLQSPAWYVYPPPEPHKAIISVEVLEPLRKKNDRIQNNSTSHNVRIWQSSTIIIQHYANICQHRQSDDKPGLHLSHSPAIAHTRFATCGNQRHPSPWRQCQPSTGSPTKTAPKQTRNKVKTHKHICMAAYIIVQNKHIADVFLKAPSSRAERETPTF